MTCNRRFHWGFARWTRWGPEFRHFIHRDNYTTVKIWSLRRLFR